MKSLDIFIISKSNQRHQHQMEKRSELWLKKNFRHWTETSLKVQPGKISRNYQVKKKQSLNAIWESEEIIIVVFAVVVVVVVMVDGRRRRWRRRSSLLFRDGIRSKTHFKCRLCRKVLKFLWLIILHILTAIIYIRILTSHQYKE